MNIAAMRVRVTFQKNTVIELAAVESTKYRIITEGRTYNITYVNPMGYKHNSLKFNCKLEKKS